MLEKLLLIRLEDFPRRIGDNYIKTTARLDDLVKFVSPMKGCLGFDVFGLQLALRCLARELRLLILDFQRAEVVQQDVVQYVMRSISLRR